MILDGIDQESGKKIGWRKEIQDELKEARCIKLIDCIDLNLC